MTDPFDVLRVPATPVDPDPAFARSLRARIERALLDPLSPPSPTEAPMTVTDMPRTLTPYLAVVDARAAVDFYVTVFGAVRRGEPIVMPDGRVGHVEVTLGDDVLMLADEFPEMELLAPRTRGGVSQSLVVEVSDPDAVVARAVAAGSVLERPVTDSPHGRTGVVVDPSGHRWMVSAATPQVRPGDVVYASLWSADPDRTARFFAAALGWADPPLRIVAGPHTGLFLCFAVDDVDAAAAVVRAAGGTATEPEDRPYGRLTDCVDDQGVPFALHCDTAGRGPAVPVPAPLYAELRYPDATRARAFYGTVLGWGFTPGYGPGYWNPTVDGDRTRPRTGLSGGHAAAVVVPSFAVPDADAAVAAVRAAGGTAEEPHRERYGRTALCTDDQGMAFVVVG